MALEPSPAWGGRPKRSWVGLGEGGDLRLADPSRAQLPSVHWTERRSSGYLAHRCQVQGKRARLPMDGHVLRAPAGPAAFV